MLLKVSRINITYHVSISLIPYPYHVQLKKNQNDMTVQMKVLLYKNSKFLEDHYQHVEEDRKAAAEKRTKELLQLSASMRNDEEITPDLEMTMMAYDDSVKEGGTEEFLHL